MAHLQLANERVDGQNIEVLEDPNDTEHTHEAQHDNDRHGGGGCQVWVAVIPKTAAPCAL